MQNKRALVVLTIFDKTIEYQLGIISNGKHSDKVSIVVEGNIKIIEEFLEEMKDIFGINFVVIFERFDWDGINKGVVFEVSF